MDQMVLYQGGLGSGIRNKKTSRHEPPWCVSRALGSLLLLGCYYGGWGGDWKAEDEDEEACQDVEGQQIPSVRCGAQSGRAGASAVTKLCLQCTGATISLNIDGFITNKNNKFNALMKSWYF